ncbi:MAG: NAD-dependent dehydratase [Pelagibacterales bacterium]|nr:NAD-dependent dehydratase [Pelagibacterales bacterium]|tara:strand:- start:3039 stop:4037 length:999 start_codon:yes stop_codon:yes gene_type:complete
MKKIFVTGADGFIGSHLVESLVKKGYDVKALVLYNSFNYWGWLDDINESIKKSIEVVTGDIRDPFGIDNAIKDCDVVINLAALIAIPYSYSSPSSYVDTNIKGTLNILESTKKHNIQKLIHTSTSEVYGSAQYIPIDEKHPNIAQSPYAATKIAADQLVLSYYRSFDTPAGIVRPFNTYGPRQSNRAIIPTTITQILSGSKEIRLGNTHPTRDFSYIDDTVNGIIKSINSDEIIGNVINLGSGFEISINDTIKLITEIIGKDIKVISDKVRVRKKLSEVDQLLSDNTLAKKILKWEPKYSNIEGFKLGLQKTIEWFSNEQNRNKYKSDIYNI